MYRFEERPEPVPIPIDVEQLFVVVVVSVYLMFTWKIFKWCWNYSRRTK